MNVNWAALFNGGLSGSVCRLAATAISP